MNETEYHQAIYEAAKDVVDRANKVESSEQLSNLWVLFTAINNLKHALEGKE